MIRTSQRTLYNIDLHLCQLLQKPYEPLTNTTLNEKFNILPKTTLPTGVYPSLKYYAIGVGGESVLDGVDGFKYSEHSPTDAALFQHIPFVMRNVLTNDLTDAEKANYRLRALEYHNGIQYACYYLKVITDFEIKPYFYSIKTLKEGTTVSSPTLSILDTNTSDLLNPTPKSRSITFENSNTINYITKLAKLNFTLLPSDIADLKNSLDILELSSSNITEIGVCTGIDIVSAGMSEVLAAQVAFHVGVNLDIMSAFANNESIMKSIEIGGSETYLT